MVHNIVFIPYIRGGFGNLSKILPKVSLPLYILIYEYFLFKMKHFLKKIRFRRSNKFSCSRIHN